MLSATSARPRTRKNVNHQRKACLVPCAYRNRKLVAKVPPPVPIRQSRGWTLSPLSLQGGARTSGVRLVFGKCCPWP